MRAVDLLRQGRKEELWQMCCGFLDLSLDQFMTIQGRLLREQIGLLNRSVLGARILRGAEPVTADQFRQATPLTTYADYCPELLERKEDILPAKPAYWLRTSGKSGEYHCKWVPVTPAFSRELSLAMYGIGILSGCRQRGDVSALNDRPRVVYTVAPRPYTSGAFAYMLQEQTDIDYLPPIDLAESMEFEDRTRLAFKHAMSRGLDYFFGLSLVLVAVGEKMGQSSQKVPIRPLLRQPRTLLRLARGLARSRLAGRPMLPRDLWSVKGIMTGGLDSAVYRERIKELWGRYPLDVYAGTEGGLIATQTWDYGDMTFIPSLNFLEFIPEAEHIKWRVDPAYNPRTVLLDEVRAGQNYEVVITNFHGGVLTRYRPGDMIKITSLSNDNLGIKLPQMAFVGRADDIIDFGVTRLTEKVIWQAVENAGLPYEDWVARKEIDGRMALHLFLEVKNGSQAGAAGVAAAIEQQLKRLDSSFTVTHGDVGGYLDFSLKVTLLPPGAFSRYIALRRSEGAELAHLKPPHINPPERVISLLTAQPVEAAQSEAAAIR